MHDEQQMVTARVVVTQSGVVVCSREVKVPARLVPGSSEECGAGHAAVHELDLKFSACVSPSFLCVTVGVVEKACMNKAGGLK